MTGSVIDLFFVVIVLLSVVRGLRAGLINGLIDLAGWLLSLLAAFRLYQAVARWLGPRVGWPEVWDRPAAFVVTAIVSGLLITGLGFALAARVPASIQRRRSIRLLGIIPGLANGLISAAIIASLLLALPLPRGVRNETQRSRLVERLAAATTRAEAALMPVFGDAIAQTLNTLTIRPDSNELVELPFTATDTPPAPELEAEMLQLINTERAKEGLQPLEADPELTILARRHSADMLARGYFAHNSPEGRSPFDRIDEAGIQYVTAGENLALAPTLSIAHTGLMNSPGHRANILRPQFGRVGIGILDAGARGLMVTQNFRD